MDEILTRIDTLRKDRKWSYYMLALEAGLTQSTITNMFYRNTHPSIKTLKALCAAFGISVAEFFEPLENKDESNLMKINDMSEDELKLINFYRTLSKEEKESVNTLMTMYANRSQILDSANIYDGLNDQNTKLAADYETYKNIIESIDKVSVTPKQNRARFKPKSSFNHILRKRLDRLLKEKDRSTKKPIHSSKKNNNEPLKKY